MTFLGLMHHNVLRRRFRATVTAFAVAIGVMAVLTLGVLTASLQETAAQILKVGNADFSISQKHVDQILNSQISTDELAQVRRVPGVGSAIGALIETGRYNADHPAVIQVGLEPSAQAAFGVNILQGRSYGAHAGNEIMLGYELAGQLHKGVGDTLVIAGKRRLVTGIYRTNIGYGNLTMMFPLVPFQGENQVPGQVTLLFVKAAPGVPPARVEATINRRFVQLQVNTTGASYGQSDLTGPLIRAANTGGTILAALIAVTGVLNTTLLSFFERIREFGVLRSIGWGRFRLIALVVGEAVIVSVAGAAIGLLLAWVAINVLQHLADLQGYFHPTYDAAVFGRALGFALVVAVLGALYPAVRAATLAPLEALRRE